MAGRAERRPAAGQRPHLAALLGHGGRHRAASGDAERRALLLGNLGDAVTGRDEDFSSSADRDVNTVFAFFDRAGLCANERICDFDVLNTFLGDAAEPFWLYFHVYADKRRAAGYVAYGAWTERFAEGRISRSWFSII
jgi:hypothetical protein